MQPVFEDFSSSICILKLWISILKAHDQARTCSFPQPTLVMFSNLAIFGGCRWPWSPSYPRIHRKYQETRFRWVWQDILGFGFQFEGSGPATCRHPLGVSSSCTSRHGSEYSSSLIKNCEQDAKRYLGASAIYTSYSQGRTRAQTCTMWAIFGNSRSRTHWWVICIFQSSEHMPCHQARILSVHCSTRITRCALRLDQCRKDMRTKNRGFVPAKARAEHASSFSSFVV
jgi:hypothetical protein